MTLIYEIDCCAKIEYFIPIPALDESVDED